MPSPQKIDYHEFCDLILPLLSFLRCNPHYSPSEFSPNQELIVALRTSWRNTLPLIGLAVLLSACASGSKVTRVQAVADSAETPYKKILVIGLFEAYDSRRYLEKELVTKLVQRGTGAVASTSMMDSKTPVTRATFLAMVDEIGADAVVVTQLASLNVDTKVKDANPQATYNIRATQYYNVWGVELTEYVAPQGVQYDTDVALATQIFSVNDKKPVWAIESEFRIVQKINESMWDYKVFVEQADVIAQHMSSDGLIAR